MKRRSKTILLITALIMILVLLGLTPLNFVHKLGSGAPLSAGKQILKCNPCPFHFLTSHPEPAQIDVNWVIYEPRPMVFLTSVIVGRNADLPGFLPDLSLLRC
jgi:hypothetical protein